MVLSYSQVWHGHKAHVQPEFLPANVVHVQRHPGQAHLLTCLTAGTTASNYSVCSPFVYHSVTLYYFKSLGANSTLYIVKIMEQYLKAIYIYNQQYTSFVQSVVRS